MIMRLILVFLLIGKLLPAQVTMSVDSTGITVKSVVEQIDGTIVTMQTAPLDTTTARDRLFNETVSTYDLIAQKKNELADLEKRAVQLRGLYAQFDTSGYSKKIEATYKSALIGFYYYRDGGQKKQLEIHEDNKKNLAVRGGKKSPVQVFSANYICVKNYFLASDNKAVDVFLTRKGQTWNFELEGKVYKLNRK